MVVVVVVQAVATAAKAVAGIAVTEKKANDKRAGVVRPSEGQRVQLRRHRGVLIQALTADRHDWLSCLSMADPPGQCSEADSS